MIKTWMRHGLPLLTLAAALAGAAPAAATVPGANGKIAFYATRTGETAIVTMNADGSGEQQLTDDIYTGSPDWSPDGTKLAFAGTPSFDVPRAIYVMNADGTRRTRITTPADGADGQPDWSPDGRKILFTRVRRDEEFEVFTYDLWVMNPDGSGQVRITRTVDNEVAPAWSPDGRKIAFHKYLGPQRIWVINADGSGEAPLTSQPNDEAPSWSPDGTKITFSRYDTTGRIWVVDADGSAPRPLTTPASGESDYGSVWSPDGRRIVFARNDRILVMNADGSGQVTLPGGVGGRDLDWQPLPLDCSDVRVGHAVAKGCFTETAAGSGVYETDEVAWVGGFEVHPRAGGKLVLDTNQRAVRATGAGARIKFGDFVVPIAVEDLPVGITDATMRLGGAGSLPEILELPLKATAKVSWQDGGTSAAFEGEIEIAKLTAPLGQLVDLGTGEGAENAGGKLKARLVNGTGFVLDAAEVAIGEINVIPAHLRVPKVLKLRNLLLRYEQRENRPFWTGRAGITVPFAGRDLTITGTVFVFDGTPAGGGLEVDGLNWLIPNTPLFLQTVGGDLLFAPDFGFDLRVGASLGPRIEGAQLMKITGTAKGGSLASGCTRGADPVQTAYEAELSPLDQLVGTGLASASLSGTSCLYVGPNPALEVGLRARVAFANGLLGYEGSQSGYVSARGASLEGATTILLPELADLEGRTLLSTVGIAACAQFQFAQAGFGYRWGQRGLPSIFTGCDLAPFSVPAGPATAAAVGRSIRVPRKLPHAAFKVVSPAGAPPVLLTGPGGRRVRSPAGGGPLNIRTAVIVPAAHERATYVLVRRPEPGRWRVRALDPALPVARVAFARGLPEPKVKARVRRAGKRRRLSYRVRSLPGQKVTFVERGTGVSRVLARTRGRRGRIAFTPKRAPGRRRTIVAEVTQNGLPRASLTVARFKAQATQRPARPKKLRIRRTQTQLSVRWRRVRGASNYLVTVGSGAAPLHRVVTRRRRLTFRDTPATGRLVVTVRALSTVTRPGKRAKRTVKPPRPARPRAGGG